MGRRQPVCDTGNERMGENVVMTNDQLQQLLAAVDGAGGGAGATAVTQLGPCNLGRDKTKRYKKFVNWIKQA